MLTNLRIKVEPVFSQPLNTSLSTDKQNHLLTLLVHFKYFKEHGVEIKFFIIHISSSFQSFYQMALASTVA